jgi:hypothetical protein
MNDFMLRNLIMISLLAPGALFAQTKYENNFEQAKVGAVPEDFLVLDGAFAVKEVDGNKVLELPVAPLDTFGLLFGPSEKENIGVSARVFASSKGRRYSDFGVGLNGVGGYKLRVSPGKKQLELYRGDDLKKSVPLNWQPNKWTHLKLQVTKSSEQKWEVQGKIWQDGKEPSVPAITFTDSDAPTAGRASVSAMPYAGLPILFDDFVVSAVK